MGKRNNPLTLSRRKLLKGLAALPLVYGMSSVTSTASELTKVHGYLSDEAIASLQDIKGKLPRGRIGKHEITRLVMGCNPMGGWSHSRDLSYVGTLSKQWHTPVKMKETWAFENGADFVCLGMYDFQVVQDVNTTIEILGNLGTRKRPWYA